MNVKKAHPTKNPHGFEKGDVVLCVEDKYGGTATGLVGEIRDSASDICELYVPRYGVYNAKRYIVNFRDLQPADQNKHFKNFLKRR